MLTNRIDMPEAFKYHPRGNLILVRDVIGSYPANGSESDKARWMRELKKLENGRNPLAHKLTDRG